MNPGEYRRMFDVEDRHWWYVGLHELILSTVRKESRRLGRPLVILDAGCGTGRLCQLLSKEGHRVNGCDVSEEALRFCRERGLSNVFRADLNHLVLGDELYDIITSVDVLYHTGILDDVAVMKSMRNALKPGGLLILNLVACEMLRGTHDVAVHTRERYTRKAVRNKLHEAGFDISLASYRIAPFFPLIAAYRLLSRIWLNQQPAEKTVNSDVALPPKLINELLLRIMLLENRVMQVVELPFGSSIYTVAVKPVE